MSLLEVHSIRKTFPGVVALDNVSLQIDPGTVHIFAGENGAGKSTLIRILTGLSAPDEGQILIEGQDARAAPDLFDRIAYVPQELSLFAHMSVAENLFLPFRKSGFGGVTLSRGQLNRAARPILARFGIRARPEQEAGTIAVSDQQLLQIARASTRRDFRVLILDEPTSSLTESEATRLFALVRQLRDEGRAVIFVSHKMNEIFDIGDRVTVLRNGVSVAHHDMHAISERELIKLMSGNEVKIDDTFQPMTARGMPLMQVEGLSGRGFADISFDLFQGEILGFAGLVGAGRSEIMQTLYGILKAKSGKVTVTAKPWHLGSARRAVQGGMSYISEERKLHGILPMLSVRENIGVGLFGQTARAGVIASARERQVVADIIREYGIRTPGLEQKIRFLSGGNQQKAIIGRAMRQRPKILIFDEPTKGIDIRTKVEIYRLMQKLAEDGIGVILVSSEMAELRRCATRIIAIHDGRMAGTFNTAETDAHVLVGAIIGSGDHAHAA